MDRKLKREDLDRLVDHFGIEKIIAALPQKEVCEVLDLVSMKNLTEKLDVRYDTLRHYMQAGVITFQKCDYFDVRTSGKKRLRRSSRSGNKTTENSQSQKKQ